MIEEMRNELKLYEVFIGWWWTKFKTFNNFLDFIHQFKFK
jgi:hypothetical protein